MTVVLHAEDISYSYGDTPALCRVGFALAAGEIVAVTGASGSGKSTLLHCLAGLVRPTSGTISLGGRWIDALSESERSVIRRTLAGIVFQFGQLVPELTVEENVALPLLLGGVRRGAALRKAGEALGRFGIADLAGRRASGISGGQQQRAAVARALITDPLVVFADEPTGALDTLAGEQVLAGLTAAARELGTAVVLATHDATVAAYANREVVLADGRTEAVTVL